MTKFSMVLVTMISVSGLAFAGDATKPAPAPAMELPKPAQEVTDMVKSMAGTWRCDGTATGMDSKDMKFKGTMTSKADLGGFWAHQSFAGNMGEGKMAMPFKFESYSTFDSSTKKWRIMMVDNMGGQMVGTSDGMKDMKMDTMSDTMDGRGKGQFKDHMDMTDMKKGAHMWGEESRDMGRTWNKVYDMTCKK